MIELYLNPGQVFAGDHRHRVHTLLGSCVSVVLWHPARRVGAMSHSLLAERPPHVGTADPRYGADAMEAMLRALRGLQIDPRVCEAQVYGGGDMGGAGGLIGRRNVELALALLDQARVPLKASDLYGRRHRRITFEVDSGRVHVAGARAGAGAAA